MASVTELPAVSTIPFARACIGDTASTDGGTHVICRHPATRKAIRTMAKKIPFIGQAWAAFFPAAPIMPAARTIRIPPR